MIKIYVPKCAVYFTVEEFAFANCSSIEICSIGSKISKFETVCMLRLPLIAEFGYDPIVSSNEITA